MSKRHLIFFTIVLVVCFSGYVGYRFYENRTKSPLAAKDANERLASINRAFLQRVESVNQLPREAAIRFSSLTPPVWTYTPERWDRAAADSVKVIALATDVVGFHATELPDGKFYQLPLPREKTLLQQDIISEQEITYIRIFTTPESMPEIPFDEPVFPSDTPMSEEPPIPYPLIAKVIIEPDDTSLTQFRDWIVSVGGAARAQSLIEAAGLSDSIRIETATSLRE